MSPALPICVDLDGSLVHTDLLHESTLLLARRSPLDLLRIPFWLTRGKAFLKARIAERAAPDYALLPYRADLVDWLRAQRTAGRRLVLCTASDERHARGVAAGLDLFDEVIASDGAGNNAGARKAAKLRERFGDRGYDYVGNGRADLPAWAGAHRAIVVGGPRIVRLAEGVATVERVFAVEGAGLHGWARALRLHQWLKNVLLFLPLLGAHRWGEAPALARASGAFLAFGLCASAVYIVNDLFDIESDRHHPRKRLRAIASGRMPIPVAILAAALLFAAAFAIATAVAWAFALWLLLYVLLTKSYTLLFKTIALIDCLALAGLYILRVVAGGAAVGQPVSFWLLAFCLFLFLSLAFVKRYAELVILVEHGLTGMRGRGYVAEDRQLLQSFGVASGFAAALVLALYLNSEAVLRLYAHPDRLWFALPILLFWILWMWLRASRGQMHDDPVVFAVQDRASLLAGALFLAAIWVAN
jgi:4-hydroxybenzoate polyprenyltransferase